MGNLLEEEGTVAKDVDNRFHVLITHLGVFTHVIRINLDISDELNKELKGELETLFSNFDQELTL